MFQKLLPRDDVFFSFFDQAAATILEGCRTLAAMLDDLGNSGVHARRIKDIESQGDEITHRTVEHLHRTFVTPIDRDVIYALITRMDDILDHAEAAADRLYLYELSAPAPTLRELARVLEAAADQVRGSMVDLSHLKRRSGALLERCIEIHRLENEADALIRRGLATLFREEPDIRQLIKWKEIYEHLEAATDRCEDVANIVEGIVLEYG